MEKIIYVVFEYDKSMYRNYIVGAFEMAIYAQKFIDSQVKEYGKAWDDFSIREYIPAK